MTLNFGSKWRCVSRIWWLLQKLRSGQNWASLRMGHSEHTLFWLGSWCFRFTGLSAEKDDYRSSIFISWKQHQSLLLKMLVFLLNFILFLFSDNLMLAQTQRKKWLHKINALMSLFSIFIFFHLSCTRLNNIILVMCAFLWANLIWNSRSSWLRRWTFVINLENV